jgi:hypothetical protein
MNNLSETGKHTLDKINFCLNNPKIMDCMKKQQKKECQICKNKSKYVLDLYSTTEKKSLCKNCFDEWMEDPTNYNDLIVAT